MTQPVYITTPLYYVNAAPHIGHSYTEVAADCLARYARLRGDDVFLLTGTDEHGEKIAQAAQAQGLTPKAFVDRNSQIFKDLWPVLGISYDRFIRTTDPDHIAVVQQVLERLRPQLQLGVYRFWYCVPCETSFGLSEIDAAKPLCVNCQRPVTQTEEEDYYLSLETHRAWLREYIQQHDTFILPMERRNEILALLNAPLPDLCITRPKDRVPWGIAVPFSPQHVTYVWFDALVNYISALGWPSDPKFHRYWEEAGAIHLIGKDILRHHALYWPIILHALGLTQPKLIFAHGWWKIGEQKMSKSLGNIVEPATVVKVLLKGQPYAADVYRYFLLRDVPFGHDGNFSEDAILTRLSDDLANDLGNLVYRTLSMIERYCDGKIPSPSTTPDAIDGVAGLLGRLEHAMEHLDFSEALTVIMDLVTQSNRFIEAVAPWKLAKDPAKAQELQQALSALAEVIRIVAIALQPFLPRVSEAIWQQVGMTGNLRLADVARWPGLVAGQSVRKAAVLFPRMERQESSA